MNRTWDASHAGRCRLPWAIPALHLTSLLLIALSGSRTPGVAGSRSSHADSRSVIPRSASSRHLAAPPALPPKTHRIPHHTGHGGSTVLAPQPACTWVEILRGHQSLSLGADIYREALATSGLAVVMGYQDKAGNHYYEAEKRC